MHPKALLQSSDSSICLISFLCNSVRGASFPLLKQNQAQPMFSFNFIPISTPLQILNVLNEIQLLSIFVYPYAWDLNGTMFQFTAVYHHHHLCKRDRSWFPKAFLIQAWQWQLPITGFMIGWAALNEDLLTLFKFALGYISFLQFLSIFHEVRHFFITNFSFELRILQALKWSQGCFYCIFLTYLHLSH